MGRLVIENYQIASERLPEEFDGVKIVYLSDLHSESLGRENEALLSAIDESVPDYVLFGGDLIVGKRDFSSEVALKLCQSLTEKYPVYMGMGNHEQKLMAYEETKDSSFPEYIEALEKMGVWILNNEAVTLRHGAGEVRLYGLTMEYKYYSKKWKAVTMESSYITENLGECDKERFSILLAHTPKYFEAYAKWGADLVLSGHVHGGIMILQGFGGVIAPDYDLFPEYDYGYFTNKESQMVLSRGLGAHTIKLRVFNPPELSILTLKKNRTGEGIQGSGLL